MRQAISHISALALVIGAGVGAMASDGHQLVEIALPQQVTPHLVRAIAELGEPESPIQKFTCRLSVLRCVW